jgi:hypothetical protein
MLQCLIQQKPNSPQHNVLLRRLFLVKYLIVPFAISLNYFLHNQNGSSGQNIPSDHLPLLAEVPLLAA